MNGNGYEFCKNRLYNHSKCKVLRSPDEHAHPHVTGQIDLPIDGMGMNDRCDGRPLEIGDDTVLTDQSEVSFDAFILTYHRMIVLREEFQRSIFSKRGQVLERIRGVISGVRIIASELFPYLSFDTVSDVRRGYIHAISVRMGFHRK